MYSVLMEDFDVKTERFNKLLDNMPKEKLDEITEKELQRSKNDFEKLKASLNEEQCCYCNHPISHFSEKKPCLHWLLKPKGFKKRHFPLIYEMKSFHEIEAYLRWVANCILPIRNINDWEEEKSESKIIEETIRYKNLEWSFSCSKNDFAGHKDRKEGQTSHYHFQMKVDDKVIINYGGFHIPFHDYDFFCFAAKNGVFPKVSYQHIHGSGMQKMFDQYTPEQLLDLMNTKHMTEGKEQFKLETLIMADEGKTISGEKIAELLKKKKETGVPLAKLVREMEGVRVVTTISPGADIPEIARRKPRKKATS